jgi:hypothetical protein
MENDLDTENMKVSLRGIDYSLTKIFVIDSTLKNKSCKLFLYSLRLISQRVKQAGSELLEFSGCVLQLLFYSFQILTYHLPM